MPFEIHFSIWIESQFKLYRGGEYKETLDFSYLENSPQAKTEYNKCPSYWYH